MAIIWNTFVVYENLVPNIKKQLIIIGHRKLEVANFHGQLKILRHRNVKIYVLTHIIQLLQIIKRGQDKRGGDLYNETNNDNSCSKFQYFAKILFLCCRVRVMSNVQLLIIEFIFFFQKTNFIYQSDTRLLSNKGYSMGARTGPRMRRELVVSFF